MVGLVDDHSVVLLFCDIKHDSRNRPCVDGMRSLQATDHAEGKHIPDGVSFPLSDAVFLFAHREWTVTPLSILGMEEFVSPGRILMNFVLSVNQPANQPCGRPGDVVHFPSRQT
jgi:hypothetical protein